MEINYKEITSCTIEDVEEISKRLKSQVSESIYKDIAVLVATATHLGYDEGVKNTLEQLSKNSEIENASK